MARWGSGNTAIDDRIELKRHERFRDRKVGGQDRAGGMVHTRAQQHLPVRGDFEQLYGGVGFNRRIEGRHERLQRGEHLAVDRVVIEGLDDRWRRQARQIESGEG